MKAILNLTFEDGAKVVEAMRDVALQSGWELDELEDCGVLEEYSRVVDAALSAMGFEVCIDPTPSVNEAEEEDFDLEDDDFEDEDEEDEDEDAEYDDSCQYSLTAKGEFVLRYMEAGHTFEEASDIADLLFDEPDDDDDDEDDNEDEEDEDDEPSDEEVIHAILGILFGQ